MSPLTAVFAMLAVASTFGNGVSGIDLPPFNSLDKDYDGYLSRTELGHAVTEMLGQVIITVASAMTGKPYGATLDYKDYAAFERNLKGTASRSASSIISCLPSMTMA